MKKINTFLLIFGVILSTLVMPTTSITTQHSENNLTHVAESNSDLELDYRVW